VSAATSSRLGATDCERFAAGWAAQPVNTATSAGYLAAGALVALRHGRPGAPSAGGALAYGAVLALVGAGSIAFHGPQPPGARVLHDLPIVALVGMAVATPVVRRARGRPALPGWSRRRGAALAGLSVAAAAAYAAGRTGAPTCDPASLLQWHGAWHLLSAAGFVVAADILYAQPQGGA
jgi:hypothetical protein